MPSVLRDELCLVDRSYLNVTAKRFQQRLDDLVGVIRRNLLCNACKILGSGPTYYRILNGDTQSRSICSECQTYFILARFQQVLDDDLDRIRNIKFGRNSRRW